MYASLATATMAALLSSPVAVAPERPASCKANQPAHIVRYINPEYPMIAQLGGVTGTSVIRVDLSDDGGISGTYVATSSGSSILDRAAIGAAKSMVYAPATQSCAPTSGSYAVEVTFD